MKSFTKRASKRLSKRRESAPLPLEAKPRPSLLQRRVEDGGNSSASRTEDPAGGGSSTLKRRFSLRDTVRRIFRRKGPETKDVGLSTDNGPAASQNTSNAQTIQEGPPPPEAEPLRSRPRVNGATADDDRGGMVEHPETSGIAVHQRGLSMTSTLSSLSEESIPVPSTATLSPRPVAALRQRKVSGAKYSEDAVLLPEDVLLVFEGAPNFFVDESKGTYGEPAVRYINSSAPVSDQSLSFFEDSAGIDHEAFRGYSNRKPKEKESPESQHHWLTGPAETPSMLSFFGHEPGSTGWQYFLEAQMVDFELEQGNPAGEIDEYGQEFQPPDSIGVRSIDSTTMVDRLRDIGKYHEQSYLIDADLETEARSLYGQLFTKLLYPLRRNSGQMEPHEYGLEVQCRELFKILEERHVWLDFSRPEERIRMGSILYGSGEEKLLLVLQILLSCELWLRLKLLHRYIPQKLELEPLYFTPKVNWDLAVAQKWLNNVRIVERPFTPDFDMLTPTPPAQKHSSWQRFFMTEEVKIEDAEEPQDADTYDAFFVPQHLERQLNGMLLFAQKIGWPGVEVLEGVIRDKLRDTAGLQTPSIAYRTPATSPGKLTPRSLGGTASRGSYFGYMANKRTSSVIVRNMGQGGWLSRTYTTGLVLPGEGLSHLVMGCLLENDTLALNEIGEQGSMYGGIIRRTLEYAGSTASWWSINNIVGKVLATYTSPRSYGGWVGKCTGIYSIKGTPYGDVAVLSAVAAKVMRNFTPMPQTSVTKDGMRLVEPIGWVDVITDRKPWKHRIPRLSKPGNVERDSKFLGASTSADQQILANQLQYPRNLAPQDITIEILGLKFWDCEIPPGPTLPETEQGYYAPKEQLIPEDNVPAFRVEAVFRVPGMDEASRHCFDSAEDDVVSLMLRYDVSFITSYPCTRPAAVDSPIFDSIHSRLRGPQPTAHPVHSSYKFKILKLQDLPTHSLARRLESSDEEGYFITVINATGHDEGVYVYAKAWCAKWGADAIISRNSRTCLSCSIREANALGVDVVICVGEA
ncbi:hypothetical protein ABW19_dt0207882 [Dactylella cylindrospora]|nr:hypothetical protein ABW19_dt0207882 [Dactylella cylindrospora]